MAPKEPFGERVARVAGTRLTLILPAAVVLVAGIALAWWYYAGRESTDDAQVDGHIAQVSASVGGRVIRVTRRRQPAGDEGHGARRDRCPRLPGRRGSGRRGARERPGVSGSGAPRRADHAHGNHVRRHRRTGRRRAGASRDRHRRTRDCRRPRAAGLGGGDAAPARGRTARKAAAMSSGSRR